MSLAGSAPDASRTLPCAGRTLIMKLVPQPDLEAGGADELIRRLCLSFVSYATAHSGRRGQIRFPFGCCNLEAHGAALQITSGAEGAADLQRVEEIVVDRLKRVARRHRRGFVWGHVDGAEPHRRAG